MSTEAGSAGTPRDGYKIEPRAGKHRAPPPPPNPPTAAWWTVATAAAALVVACVVAIAVDVAPDASAAAGGVQVPTVTRAQETAGPLEIPTIGASGAWSLPEDTTKNALSRPVPTKSTRTSTVSIRASEERTDESAANPTPSEADVVTSPEPSDDPQLVQADATVSESPTPTATETPSPTDPTPTVDPLPTVTEALPSE